MKILGAIIAGGQSSRMGGAEKAFLDFGGQPLIAHIVKVLQEQTNHVVINANGDPARFADLGCDVVGDGPAFHGTPLAGLAAVLNLAAAQNFDAVVTTPSDTPFLPHDLVARLSGYGAAIAHSAGQDHYLTGFWPSSLASFLADPKHERGLRRMQDWVTLAGAHKVEWPGSSIDPFFNVNTPENLAEIQAWLKDQR